MANSRKRSTELSASALARILFHELDLSPQAQFRVAFSGGLDSHVLLHVLTRLRDTHSLAISAIHVHHGLQADADAWTAHCAQVCAALAVPLEVVRVRVAAMDGEGIEAAARAARYAALARLIRPGDILLTAHQQDDQAETLLLQLLRGTGVAGLAAMPAVAPFGPGRLVRPLLGFPRSALVRYAESAGLSWVEDPMNLDSRFARSFLRAEVLPLLTRRWPQAGALLARSARHAAEAAAILEEVARGDLADAVRQRRRLAIPPLLGLTAARRRNALRHWLVESGFKPPSALHLQELERLATRASRSRHALLRWPGAEVRRYRDELFVMTPLPRPRLFRRVWDPGAPLALPEIGCTVSAVPVRGQGLAQARLANARIEVRSRAGGESCVLPGRGRHVLKKLFQEAGVPPWERTRLPFVFVDDRLAAVGDLWVCEPFAAAPEEPAWRIVLDRH